MNTGKNLTNYGNSQFLTEEIEVKPKVLMFYKNLIIVGVRTGKLLVKGSPKGAGAQNVRQIVRMDE